MDQKKIGEFLRELRKEKGLTQEQLAEQFNVSGRTVSRWETGSNMPDISIIPEMADFYGVDIREIIEGERRPAEAAEASPEDDVTKVIEYAGEESSHLARKVMWASVVGMICLMCYVLLSRGLLPQSILRSLIEAILLFFVYGSIGYSISFTSGRLEKKLEKRKGLSPKRIILFVLMGLGAFVIFVCVAAALLVAPM